MRTIDRFKDELYHVWLTLLHLLSFICPYTPLKRIIHRLRGTKVGKNVNITGFVFLEESFPELIEIEDNVELGPGVMIVSHDSSEHMINPAIPVFKKKVLIKRNVYIGARAIILPGVTVGEYSIIGAGSVVTKDIPPRKIAVGVPARVIRGVDEKKGEK